MGAAARHTLQCRADPGKGAFTAPGPANASACVHVHVCWELEAGLLTDISTSSHLHRRGP